MKNGVLSNFTRSHISIDRVRSGYEIKQTVQIKALIKGGMNSKQSMFYYYYPNSPVPETVVPVVLSIVPVLKQSCILPCHGDPCQVEAGPERVEHAVAPPGEWH